MSPPIIIFFSGFSEVVFCKKFKKSYGLHKEFTNRQNAKIAHKRRSSLAEGYDLRRKTSALCAIYSPRNAGVA